MQNAFIELSWNDQHFLASQVVFRYAPLATVASLQPERAATVGGTHYALPPLQITRPLAER